jgi:hypothetical protein
MAEVDSPPPEIAALAGSLVAFFGGKTILQPQGIS